MENREYFKKECKSLKEEKAKSGSVVIEKKASDYPELITELGNRQSLLTEHFPKLKALVGFRWIEGYSHYLNIYLNLKRPQSIKPKKWSIVNVDFFGSFPSEMEHDHPALVYKIDNENGLILVIPITSDQSTFEKAKQNSKTLYPIKKYNKNLGNLTKDSTLLLNQLKMISLDRILPSESNVERKIAVTIVKSEIDSLIAKLYSANILNRLEQSNEKLQKQLDKEQKKTSQLIFKNEELKSELEKLKKKLEENEETFF